MPHLPQGAFWCVGRKFRLKKPRGGRKRGDYQTYSLEEAAAVTCKGAFLRGRFGRVSLERKESCWRLGKKTLDPAVVHGENKEKSSGRRAPAPAKKKTGSNETPMGRKRRKNVANPIPRREMIIGLPGEEKGGHFP